MTSLIGQTVSHYRILEKIGEGGMGVVYKAEDTRLDRTVALKVITSDAYTNVEERIRFSHEAKAAASFSHSNVATIYEFGEGDDQAGGKKVSFIAMEFIAGETLSRKIGARPLPVADAVAIALCIAEALAKAHENRIVHRDIKSDNIMFSADGAVKVLDFGLASVSGRTKLTKAGMTLGTVAYMSPEQARGETVDPRSDLWSLGVVLYEMLAGKLPFSATYEQAMIFQILNDEPEPITSLRSNVPMELERICRKLLQKNRAARYLSAGDLLVDLHLLNLTTGPGSSRRVIKKTSTGFRLRGRGKILVGAGSLLVIGVIAGYTLFSHPSGAAIRSLAVLPFENLSKDADQEYFADGMTDQLITELSRIHSIRVISRKTSMQFKDRHELLPKIGSALNVGALITATVLRSGDRVRVNVQLIRASDEENLWTESYERKLEGVLDLHAALARSIAQRISATLTPAEESSLSLVRPVNPEAFDLVARGNYLLNSSADSGNFKKASALMVKAIGIDSTYPDALVGFAFSIVQQYGFGIPVTPQLIAEAEAAIMKALVLNPTSGRAYGVRGQVYWIEGDMPACFRAHDRAVELSPNDGLVLTNHSWILMLQGKFDEGVAEARKAVEVDPLSQYARCNLMGWYYTMHRFRDAEAEAHRILDLDSNWTPALWQIAIIAEHESRFDDARQYWSKYLHHMGVKSISPRASWQEFRAWRMKAFEQLGDHATIVYLLLLQGENEKAMSALEKCVDRWDSIILLLFYPDFDPLRSDPRFAGIVTRVRLPLETYCTLPKK